MTSVGSTPPNAFASMRRPPKPSAGERFSQLDRSGDGKLSEAELSKMAQDISQRTGKDISAEDLRAKLDGNGDGSISLDELKQGKPPRGPRGPRGPEATEAFDQKGSLSSDVVSAMAANMSSITGPISGSTLNATLDNNGDGNIDQAEVNAMMAKVRLRKM